MTTVEDIDNQIKNDLNRFWQSRYDGNIPSGFIYRFRSALMFHNAKSLQGSIPVMRALINAKEEDLSFLQVGIIINTIFAVPFNAMYDSPEQAFDALEELHEIELEYNELVEKNATTLQKKKNKLLEISGHGGKTIRINGKQN